MEIKITTRLDLKKIKFTCEYFESHVCKKNAYVKLHKVFFFGAHICNFIVLDCRLFIPRILTNMVSSQALVDLDLNTGPRRSSHTPRNFVSFPKQ